MTITSKKSDPKREMTITSKNADKDGKREMTITSKNADSDGKREMTMDDFKLWLKKFDADNDGRISTDELREAIRTTRAWFPGRKSKRGVQTADANGDGYIDNSEIKYLVEFAQKEMGVRIVPY